MQYFFILVIFIIVATLLSSNSKRSMAITILFLSVLLIFLFSAFRIGFTPDYYNYEIDYDNPDSVLDNERHKNEWLFIYSVRYLTYRWSLIIQAFLLCLCLYIAQKKYVPQRYWSYGFLVFFFCTSFFLVNLSGYRSSFVTIGFFMALMLKISYKMGWLYGTIVMTAASLIHQSGWIMIPLLLIPAQPLKESRYKILLIAGIIIIFLSLFLANVFNSLALSVVQYYEEYETYMQKEISNTRELGYFTIFRLLLLCFLFFYSFNWCKKDLPKEEILFVKMTAIFFLLNLMPGIGLISRFYSYFAFTSIAGFGVMVKHEKNGKLRLGFIIAFILFSIWSFYLLTHTSYYKTTYMIYDSVLF